MSRGRVSQPQQLRGRSSSRGRQSNLRGGGRLGFFNRNVRAQERDKLEDIKNDVSELPKIAKNIEIKNAEPTAANTKLREKINNNVDKGKEFINKFFRGFIQPERGNVKVELDNHITNRLTEPYVERISSYTEKEFPNKPDKNFEFYHKYKGMMNVSMAIKLFRSSTDYDKNLNIKFSSIRNVDIPMPKKVNMIINNIGKTDLLNDNRIRIASQHLLVKKYMLRGVTWYLQDDIDQFLNGGHKYQDTIEKLENSQSFDLMIDKTLGSVETIKKLGKQHFVDKSNDNYEFKIGHDTFEFRLPKFEFSEQVDVDQIKRYFKNKVFDHFTWDEKEVGLIIASLVFQVCKFSWIKNRNKTMMELEPGFKDTIVGTYIFSNILRYAGITFLDEYIDDDVLDDVMNDVLHKWKTADVRYFHQMFEMEEFKFSDFGSDAQLIEVNKFKTNQVNEFGQQTWALVDRQEAKTVLKTSESGAILGLCVGFNKNVSFSSKFLVQHDSKNSQILREFIKSDFKT
jgi:hypothetical protein